MTSTPTEPDTTLLIQCPNCGKDFRIKASFMGQSGLCTSCGQRFTITDAAAVNPAEAPLPRPTQTNPGGEAQSDTQRPPAPSGGAIGPNSQEIAQLNARIAQLFKAGQYTEAMPPAREVCKLVREDSGAISEGYAASLRNVGAIYYKLGNKADGDKFMQTSEEVRRKLGGGETGNVDDSTSEAKTRDVDNRTGEAKTLEWEPKGVFAADDLNYCFYLPSGGWYRYGRSAEREALADMVLEKTGVGVIRVVVGQCVPGETFESLCRRVEEIYVEETPDFQQIDAGPARVAGKEAAFIEFRGRGEDLDEEIRCLSYLVERDDCFVQIIAIGVPDIFAEFRDDIGGLIESFSFDRTEILAAQELDRKMAMRKLLLPGAAAVFVPLFSILGWLISSADAHDHANNTSLGEPGVPLWWLIYPLIGYYISVGWAASGFSGCRNLRQWLTNIGAKLSAWIIMIMYAPFAAMFDSDKGDGGVSALKTIGRFTEVGIHLWVFVFGRLISAFTIPIPQFIWQAVTGGRVYDRWQALWMHLLGIVPALFVLFVFFAPISGHASIRMQRRQLLNVAREACRTGDLDRAEGIYREILEAEPHNANVLNALAWMLATNRKDYKAALVEIDKAVKSTPDWKNVWGTRGVILSNIPGRLADARKDFEKSVELSIPDSSGRAWSLFHLGLTCNKLKDYPAAREHLKEASQINAKTKGLTLEERSKIDKILRTLPAKKPGT